MKQSRLFTKTTRQAPKDEESINAKLLVRGGFVQKLMAGVYSYLPLGFKVVKKIENIIREELYNISAQEILMPALHPKKIWEKTDRWKYEEMFKLENRSGQEFSLGWTHEEIVVPLIQGFVQSYRDLPLSVFQIQDKFRDELRAKSGMLRGVEFLMKDLYSFHKDTEDLNEFYLQVKDAYFKIFDRAGIKDETIYTLASGGTFSKYSHEFQTITPAGEDTIYICPKCRVAVNEEIIEDQNHQCPECQNKKLEIKTAIEVGNIFKQQDKFTKPFGFTYKDQDGKEKSIQMGAYGIGLGRLMGAVVEVHYDDEGIIWPEEVAPFRFHLLRIGDGEELNQKAEEAYQQLSKEGFEVLFDDREGKSAGEKFADYDLIGIPWRIVISENTLKEDSVELKKRDQEELKKLKINQLIQELKNL